MLSLVFIRFVFVWVSSKDPWSIYGPALCTLDDGLKAKLLSRPSPLAMKIS